MITRGKLSNITIKKWKQQEEAAKQRDEEARRLVEEAIKILAKEDQR